jgi:hypothetical protein
VAAARALHRIWVRRLVASESRGGRRPTPTIRALELAGRLHSVAAGDAGFTRGAVACPALERVILMPWPGGDETAVLADLRRSTPEARRLLVAGLRDLQREAVVAIGSPFHPLFPEAHRLLGVTGEPAPLLLGAWRARRSWRVRKRRVDPEMAETVIAERLVRAGMVSAALQAVELGSPGGLRDRMLRLVRFLAPLERADRGTQSLGSEEFSRFGPELVLLHGRRLREFLPGSPLLSAVPGGAAALERAVGDVDAVVGDLCLLHDELPSLAPQVRLVLARLLGTNASRLRAGLRRGRVKARPDPALRTHLRGLALLDEGRPREALGEFEAVAAGGGPLTVQAAYSASWVRRRLGAGSDPARALRECVEARGADPDARLLLARFLADSGDETGARAVYEGALSRFPDSVQLRVAYAQDLLGWGDAPTARKHLETVHRRHPQDARLAFLAGRARVAAGQPDEAVAPLLRACRSLQGGERAEAQFWLLSAYREQGSHEEALELADALVDGLGASQVRLLEELADYFEEQHEFLRARRAEERARRLRGEW